MAKKAEPKLVIGVWAKIIHDNPVLLTREQLLKFQSLVKESMQKALREEGFEVKDVSIFQRVREYEEKNTN